MASWRVHFRTICLALNSARLRAHGGDQARGRKPLSSVFGEGEGALRREVKVWHRRWSHGRGISLFICPKCGGKAEKICDCTMARPNAGSV